MSSIKYGLLNTLVIYKARETHLLKILIDGKQSKLENKS